MKARLALAVLLLSACASPVQWDKQGAAPDAVEADKKQCSEQARVKAMATLAPPPLPQPGMIGAPVRQEDQYAMREAQEFRACMLGKGYSEKRP